MSLEPVSKIDEQEDTVFEADSDEETSNSEPQRDRTPMAEGGGGGARVVMDSPSLELLSGSKVDYTTELIGSQFKIVDNPRAISNCGCGTSFDVRD
jgi:iron-sulfur cluster assembly 2